MYRCLLKNTPIIEYRRIIRLPYTRITYPISSMEKSFSCVGVPYENFHPGTEIISLTWTDSSKLSVNIVTNHSIVSRECGKFYIEATENEIDSNRLKFVTCKRRRYLSDILYLSHPRSPRDAEKTIEFEFEFKRFARDF